jgi:energy-coupling factor transport system ATP-binding protein
MSIQVRGLKHVYSPGLPDEQLALDNINFDIYDGETVAVVGHTGSGKSTLVQHLNGLLKPTEGTITVGGVEITAPGTSMLEVRRRVGLVFQYPEYQLFEETVAADVAFGPKNLGLTDDEVNSRVRDAIELVGLDYDEIKDRSPFELSGGQKRRVAIAGVIAMKPQVLILDEPTAGLDPGAHRDILDMIEEIKEISGNITIFVSHNMADVAALADKVMVMDKGRLLMMGTPREVFAQKDRLKEAGLSVPPVTELMAELKEKGAAVDDTVLSLKEAEEEIYKFLTRNR